MDVIAERMLELRVADATIPVAVRLGRPRQGPAGDAWICEYEICFGVECRSMGMHGIDAMQALQLSLATLDVELAFGARRLGGSLYSYDEPFRSVLDGGNLRVVPAS
jgi:hypothetical protein